MWVGYYKPYGYGTFILPQIILAILSSIFFDEKKHILLLPILFLFSYLLTTSIKCSFTSSCSIETFIDYGNIFTTPYRENIISVESLCSPNTNTAIELTPIRNPELKRIVENIDSNSESKIIVKKNKDCGKKITIEKPLPEPDITTIQGFYTVFIELLKLFLLALIFIFPIHFVIRGFIYGWEKPSQ